MNDGTSELRRCEICRDPIRPDNEVGICAVRPECINERKRRATRKPQVHEKVAPAGFCEVCERPLRKGNTSGICSDKTPGSPCLARRNKLANEARIPAGYEPRRCELCGERIKDDNRTGVCGSRERPDCRKESRRRLRETRTPRRKRERVSVTAGDVFGKWTVLESRSGKSKVPVECECGNKKDVDIYNLIAGRSQSCRCGMKEASARRFPDPYIAAGTVFGRLTVLEDVQRQQDGNAKCRCACGNPEVVTITEPASLKAGHTRSCGCLRREANTTHGLSKHPLYRTWKSMIYRCENPNADSYENYSDHDITVCEEWHDAAVFVTDIEREIGLRPEGRYEKGVPHFTLDRIDNDLGYQPGNVRWNTQSGQLKNRRKVGTLTRERKADRAELDAKDAQIAALTARNQALTEQMEALRKGDPADDDRDTLF